VFCLVLGYVHKKYFFKIFLIEVQAKPQNRSFNCFLVEPNNKLISLNWIALKTALLDRINLKCHDGIFILINLKCHDELCILISLVTNHYYFITASVEVPALRRLEGLK
jgi:hypothetical protein